MTTSQNQTAGQADDPSAAAAVDAGPALLTDAVVVVSAGVFALALKLALQIHAGVAPMFAGLVAVVICLGLVATHLVLRQKARPTQPSRRKARRLPAAAAAAPEFESAHAPRFEGLSAALSQDAHQPQPQPWPQFKAETAEPTFVAPPLAPAAPLTSDGIDHLQHLVAELARATPGPKADTPDPDAPHQVATAQAWAQYAAKRPAEMLQSNAPLQASAQHPHPAPLTGFAADLADALAADRMTIYLEPIQQIESDHPRYYEVSIRFKDEAGGELPHREMIAAARESGLLPRVDAAVLPRAARIAQHFRVRGRDTDIFSRVHAVSLPDQDFRAEVTAATIAADGAALVLSFEQSDLRSFGPIHWEILSTMYDMGLRFAVEGVTDLDMDFDAIRNRGFEFVKLDAEVLLRGLPAFGGTIASADVCRHLAASGLALIVGHIDDDEALARILGFGVLFGQGALFGTRRAVRSDILATPAAAA